MVYICMLYYVIKYIFIVCDKYVYDYVYSNMYKYWLCNYIYFGIIYIYSCVMMDFV